MSFPAVMIAAGILFMAVAIFMNFRGRGSEVTDAGAKGVVVKAPAYVMIAGLGVLLILGGGYFASQQADRTAAERRTQAAVATIISALPATTEATTPPPVTDAPTTDLPNEVHGCFEQPDGQVLCAATGDVLYEACWNGDMQACDDLWVTSDLGTEGSRLASTCGDLLAEPIEITCVAEFGPFVEP